MSAGEAFVTLVTTDSYCMGAVVVAKSLRHHGTTRSIVVMVTPNVSEQSRVSLNNVFDEVITVGMMDSRDPLRLSLLGRPELGTTFTKIRCWTLTQYSKCVFLDADTLVLCNVDELFEREELSAAPDPGWPDCFNSGVFVFRPSLHTHCSLVDHALQHGSFDGGDQGLLNSFFSSWPEEDIGKHLPFIYNLSGSSVYSYLPAFQKFGHNAKIVHFTGTAKPWSTSSMKTDNLHLMGEFVYLWWKEFLSYTPASLSSSSSSSSSPSQSPPSSPISPSSPSLSLPDAQISQDSEKPQLKMQEREDKMPLTGELDSSDRHLSPPSEGSPSPSEPEKGPLTGETQLKDELKPSEGPEVLGQEVVESSIGTENPDTETQPTSTADQEEVDGQDHRRQWEAGNVDYLGRDAFTNIQKMLDRFLD